MELEFLGGGLSFRGANGSTEDLSESEPHVSGELESWEGESHVSGEGLSLDGFMTGLYMSL